MNGVLRIPDPAERPGIVIVGAGFAGFHCARALNRRLGSTAELIQVNPERGVSIANVYVRPDGQQLRELAGLLAECELEVSIDVSPREVEQLRSGQPFRVTQTFIGPRGSRPASPRSTSARSRSQERPVAVGCSLRPAGTRCWSLPGTRMYCTCVK
jgi:hypothetical protein